MKRKDMDRTVLYAIKADGYNTRPGLVLDPGTNPDKVKVRVFWRWAAPDGLSEHDQDHLDTRVDVIQAGTFDDKECSTAGVVKPWLEYVAERRAELDARIAAQAAIERNEQERKDRNIARATAAGRWVDCFAYYADKSWASELLYAATHGYPGERRYSYDEVCSIIEYLTGSADASFHLTVAMGNDAFVDNAEAELADILERTAAHVRDGADAGTLADSNGNTVGSFAVLGLGR